MARRERYTETVTIRVNKTLRRNLEDLADLNDEVFADYVRKMLTSCTEARVARAKRDGKMANGSMNTDEED